MTVMDINKAKDDEVYLNELYRKIFFDKNNNPIVRRWLVKNGVHYNALDDLVSDMVELFLITVHKYNNDKIPFEKYMWTRFYQFLMNYKNNLNLKKNDIKINLNYDNMTNNNDEERTYNFDIGYVTDYDYDLDLDIITKNLNHIQSYIFKCKLGSMSDEEIYNYISGLFDVDEFIYEMILEDVKDKVMEYIARGKL